MNHIIRHAINCTSSLRLLSVLADTGTGADSRQRVDDANVACRKLAAAHPIVMIR